VLVSLIIGLIQTGVLLFLFSVFVKSPALSQALGVQQPNFHIGMITFGILYSPVSMIIGLLGNLLSRRNEYQADEFACEHSDPAALATALKKLSLQNLSNLTPHPLYVFFHYSHPPLYERLKNIQKYLLHES
jgi:STE24 endopeptidase